MKYHPLLNNVVFLVMLCFIVSSCSKSENETSHIQEDSFFVCDGNNIIATKEAIIKNPERFIQVNSLDDGCIIEVVDSLVHNSGSTSLFALDRLCRFSDGYLSEYIDSQIPNLMNNNLKNLLTYTMSIPENVEYSLRHFIIMHFVYSATSHKEMTQNEIDKYFNEKLNSNELSSSEKLHLQNLKKEIDKKISEHEN